MEGSVDSFVNSSASCSPMQFLPMQPEFVDYHDVYVHSLDGLVEQHELNSMFVDEDPLQVGGVDPTTATTTGRGGWDAADHDGADGGDLDEAYRTQANILRMCLEDQYSPNIGATSDCGYLLGDTPMTAFPDLPHLLGLPPAPTSFTPSPSTSLEGTPGTPTPVLYEYACPRCPRRYSSRTGLNRHVRAKHERPPEWYPCDVCGKSLASVRSLRMHQYLHTGYRPFPCPDCPAGFVRPYELRQHREAKHPASMASMASTPSSFAQDSHVGRVRGGLAHCGASSRGSAGHIEVIELDDDDDVVEVDADEAGRREPSIVLRLTRCSDPEGQWRVVHLTKL